jgi:hypothetical protein
MRSQMPVDSPAFTALRGIVTAARHYKGDSFPSAVELHTANLDREQLVELVALLGATLYALNTTPIQP